jgi:hypothetical protein
MVYRTEDELLDAMTLLQTNPALRDEIGDRGHAAYLENIPRRRASPRAFVRLKRRRRRGNRLRRFRRDGPSGPKPAVTASSCVVRITTLFR